MLHTKISGAVPLIPRNYVSALRGVVLYLQAAAECDRPTDCAVQQLTHLIASDIITM